MQQRPESRNWLYTPHGPDSLRGNHLARPDVSRPHGVRTHAGPGADGARAGEDPLSLRATLRSAHARDRLAREHQQVLPLTPLCAPPHARGSTVHGDGQWPSEHSTLRPAGAAGLPEAARTRDAAGGPAPRVFPGALPAPQRIAIPVRADHGDAALPPQQHAQYGRSDLAAVCGAHGIGGIRRYQDEA